MDFGFSWDLTWRHAMAPRRHGPWEEPHRSQHRFFCPESMRLGFFVLFSVMPNLEVLDVVVNVPLLVHGLHPQVLLGLVHTLDVVIIPAQIIKF